MLYCIGIITFHVLLQVLPGFRCGPYQEQTKLFLNSMRKDYDSYQKAIKSTMGMSSTTHILYHHYIIIVFHWMDAMAELFTLYKGYISICVTPLKIIMDRHVFRLIW